MSLTKAKHSIPEDKVNKKVLLTINSFGPLLKIDDLPKLSADSKDLFIAHLVRSLEFFFNRPFATLKEEDLTRYTEVTTEDAHIVFAPAYPNIVERIVKPLVTAKRHYSLGDYVSCIAVSGIICEMLTLLVWKMSTIRIHGQDITPEGEEKLFGKNFEKSEQKRRIDILLTIKAITDEQYKKFDNIRDTRNKYMHAWEYDTKQQKGDARRLMITTLLLFKEVTDMKLIVDKTGDQKVTINPRLHEFLQKSNTSKNTTLRSAK